MIHSMTAFARKASENEMGSIVWELRSVNHRYLDLSIRLPENMRELELPIRERLRNQLNRGKVECTLRYQLRKNEPGEFSINQTLVSKIAEAADTAHEMLVTAEPLRVMEVLTWPGVLQTEEANTEEIHKALLQTFDKGLQELIAAREQEGKALYKVVEQRLDSVLNEVEGVIKRMPEQLKAQREKIISRLEEVKSELNTERVEQEMVLLAQRVDVTEELDRLKTHVKEVKRVLEQGGPVGRRLDFLMQELNREANTLASKSLDKVVSSAAVELKVLIEQMREQVQNIE